MENTRRAITLFARSPPRCYCRAKPAPVKNWLRRPFSESPRARQPFVAVNCGAIAESLLESELFGYDEGAFTGARRGGHAGLFEAANRGTLFLDEIGEMPLNLQTRLLRVLEEREIVRVGGVRPVAVDVRIISATHCDLEARIREGKFRSDLFYRLAVLRLQLPPLRERHADIMPLAEWSLKHALAAMGARPIRICMRKSAVAPAYLKLTMARQRQRNAQHDGKAGTISRRRAIAGAESGVCQQNLAGIIRQNHDERNDKSHPSALRPK
jgi:propionate catabolism operon transcriptional regulator